MSTSLPKRRLGSSGPEISTVGFGAWAAGGGGWAFSWGPQDDDASVAAIRHAVDRGVNWVDTAAVYGYGHSEEVHIETATKISAADVCDLLRNAAGVELMDGTGTGQYPTAVTESSGNDPVYVGRVREDISHPSGINLWVVSDNIRKGAALNSVQIAEILAKNHL